MKFLTNNTLHHFKICFPVPADKVQNCLKRLQNLNNKNSKAICLSLSGHSESPETCQLLYDSLFSIRETSRIPIHSFLEDYATSLTYLTSAVAQTISANPYCLVGDVGHAYKRYKNVKKLLDLIGVQYQEYGTKNQYSKLWNQFIEANETQKLFAQKWLNIVESQMVKTISFRRSIPEAKILQMRNKLFQPKQALENKLIDSIQTFQEFKEVNFPNHSVDETIYKLETKRSSVSLFPQEVKAIRNLLEIIEMPNVVLYSMEDPLAEAIGEVLALIKARLNDFHKLEELDAAIPIIIQKISMQIPQTDLLI